MDAGTATLMSSRGDRPRSQKRSYSEMASRSSDNQNSNAEIPQSWAAANYRRLPDPSSSSAPRLVLPPLTFPPAPIQRTARSGYDYRRPEPLTHNSRHASRHTTPPTIEVEYVDLTSSPETSERHISSSRQSPPANPPANTIDDEQTPLSFGRTARGGPRFPREIIDITSDEPAPAENEGLSGPDIELISVRPRSPPPPPRPIEIEDSDDIQLVSAREVLRPAFVPLPPHNAFGLMPMLEGGGPFSNPIYDIVRTLGAQFAQRAMRRRPATINFENPRLNYETTGFAPRMPRPETPSPVEITAPPPAAPAGFTRNPAEGDIILCPNCGDELCTGEGDLKKQVWVVKGCGHVYCGECTKGRHVPRSKNGKAKATTEPFKTCKVDDCNQRVSSATAMIQLFL